MLLKFPQKSLVSVEAYLSSFSLFFVTRQDIIIIIIVNSKFNALQGKKSQENLKEITHKVFFDVEIDGKPAGVLLPLY